MLSKGISEETINQMDENKIRKYNTGSNFYVKGSITPVDSIEDIKISFNI